MKLSLALLASLAATVTPAAAQPPAPETRVVSVAELDLGSDSGRQALDGRLVQAVIDLCGKAADVDLAGRNDVRHCRAETLAKARAQAEVRIAARSVQPIRLAPR